MTRPKVIITGSSGTLGKLLFSALTDEYELIGIDINNEDAESNYCADISNLEHLQEIFRNIGISDALIHLAASSDPQAPWDEVLKNNIIGTRNVYECARQFQIPKVIFASSVHVTWGYHDHPERMNKHPQKITVEMPVFPISDYGGSKVFGEALARKYHERSGIVSVCLRIGWYASYETAKQIRDPLFKKIWISPADMVAAFRCCLHASHGFHVYYATSNNKGRFLDLGKIKKHLGYRPKDNASKFFRQ